MNYQDRLDSLIKFYAEKYDLDWIRVKAVCMAESSMNTLAVSRCGALGLMQIMPATGEDMGFSEHYLYDPDTNISCGCKYLQWCYWKYGEILNEEERWKFAHAAYNAGRGNINKAERIELMADGSCQTWLEAAQHLHKITGSNANETLNYVEKIERFIRAEKRKYE